MNFLGDVGGLSDLLAVILSFVILAWESRLLNYTILTENMKEKKPELDYV
jgi:hypothetical protein